MSKETNVRPGHWWAMCCILDLYKVENEEEAAEANGYMGFTSARAWSTAKEAVEELLLDEDVADRPQLLEDFRKRNPDVEL